MTALSERKNLEDLTQVRNNIVALKDYCGSYKAMYQRIHGKEPESRESKTFNNKINRGAYKAELIIQLIKAFDLHDVSLGEFYFGDITPYLEAKNKK